MTATITQRSLTASIRQHLADTLSQEIDLELSTLDLNFILEIVRKTDDAVEGVQREEQKILMDGNASDQGKSKALASLADRETGRFAFLARIVSQHDEQIMAVEQKLYARLAPPTTEDSNARLIRELRAAEIRAGLEGENADAVFLRAIKEKQFEIIWALTTNPLGSPISPEVFERGEIEFAKEVDPVSLSGKKSLEIVRDRIAGILDFVRSWLLRLGASPATIERHLSV